MRELSSSRFTRHRRVVARSIGLVSERVRIHCPRSQGRRCIALPPKGVRYALHHTSTKLEARGWPLWIAVALAADLLPSHSVLAAPEPVARVVALWHLRALRCLTRGGGVLVP